MAKHGWRWDQIHQPTPLTPLAQNFLEYKVSGMWKGLAAIGRPMRMERVFANGYSFLTSLPVGADAAEFLAKVEEHDLENRLGRLLDLWEEEYRPEVEALFGALQTWASDDESLPDLMGRFDELAAISRRLGELHSVAFGISGVGQQRFEAFCTAAFGASGALIASEAIAGMPNKSLESADRLWQFSREALALPAVAALLRERAPTDFLVGLDATEGGAEFRAALDGYLDVNGHRNESFSELAFPTWREDPRFVVFLLKSYLDAPEEQSPAALHARTMEKREARTEEARQRLDDAESFEEFLEAQRIGQQRTILIEDHNYHIDQRAFSAQRVPCLAIGERLVRQGSIDAAEDVFYVFAAELQEAAADPAVRYQDRVAERRADRERWLRILPPNVIGDGEVRVNEQMGSFLGPVDAEPSEPGEVRGVAASPGIVRGTARVVLGLDQVDRLERGDILVTYATAPPWTPLFAVAAAVVTDAGGPLSHAAIVAREYGIPAVLGTKGATARIEDGMLITVDGNKGVVRIEQ
jgi:phosphohistidine swiveling domain-containing protein